MTEIKITRYKRLNSDDLSMQPVPQQNCLRQSLPSQLGEGRSLIFQLDPALSYIETTYQPLHDLAITSKIDFDEPRLVVTLGLAGHTRFIDSAGHELTFSEGHTTITSFDSSDGERQYQANKPIKQLRFSIGKRWMDRYLGENESEFFFRKNPLQLLSCRPTRHQSLTAARQLLGCDLSAPLAPLMLNGQAMMILANELGSLCRPEKYGYARFDQTSRNMADRAHEILEQQYKDPPSLENLAKTLGITLFKLKNLFQHYFNNTPYGVVTEIRMQHAYRALALTRQPISLVAESVGYRHASNFSLAFSKYFGVSPKQITKKR
ncbi:MULTISPECIES: helix-turn-helix transcriptional regulator [Methylomonas]|uniref:AraC family transcriptional regulator n=2 Tax=Methylomonas TaxID=416 RepID=A0A140E439_9GAMM|nr:MULTISPECIES: AraC family transcriptional regulator [Methylomonas]AMK75163.1 AraC family transcriptional regulator [Methylomonas denitrificans]OAH99437.1 AraC family transcriptional regulator [Methylomonas methanica]TCV85090.1 AraC-like DNA-binding protein [Methylomonas methanica]